jgi:hypothetical protein
MSISTGIVFSNEDTDNTLGVDIGFPMWTDNYDSSLNSGNDGGVMPNIIKLNVGENNRN